ncbi:MAG TPA: hypothetical protein VJ600_06720 [Holophagaceae bacterium]|nr:hypothetical protein [Holophagaceae bacterium]
MLRRALSLLLALPVLAQVPAATATAPAPALQSRFLGKAEAAQMLTSDDYFHLLHVAELRAKTGLELAASTPDQARSDAKARYAAEAQDFNPAEEAMLRGVLARASARITAKAPLMARTPFAFIKAGQGVEGGLPHTRGACIVLSPRILAALVAAEAKGDLARLDAFAADLLVHEQFHVLERQHPELFASLFTEVFGFRRLASAPDSPALQDQRVVNPDGPDLAWAFPVPGEHGTRWIRPDLLLRTELHPKMPQDFRMVAVDLENKGDSFTLAQDGQGQPEVEELDAVQAYAQAFPEVGESFHPNEIAAVLLAAWITGQEKEPGQPLRIRTAAWARTALR